MKKIIPNLAEKLNLSEKSTSRIVDIAVSVIKQRLILGETILINDIASFSSGKKTEQVLIYPDKIKKVLIPPGLFLKITFRDRKSGRNLYAHVRELKTLISIQANLDEKGAQLFLDELIKEISKSLQTNPACKIADFGTFKKISRPGFSFNPKSRIVGKRSRIIFFSDKSFQNELNKDFSCFEPVILPVKKMPEKKQSVSRDILKDLQKMVEAIQSQPDEILISPEPPEKISIVFEAPEEKPIAFEQLKEQSIVFEAPEEKSIAFEQLKEQSIVFEAPEEKSIVFEPSEEQSIVFEAPEEKSIVFESSEEQSIVFEKPDFAEDKDEIQNALPIIPEEKNDRVFSYSSIAESVEELLGGKTHPLADIFDKKTEPIFNEKEDVEDNTLIVDSDEKEDVEDNTIIVDSDEKEDIEDNTIIVDFNKEEDVEDNTIIVDSDEKEDIEDNTIIVDFNKEEDVENDVITEDISNEPIYTDSQIFPEEDEKEEELFLENEFDINTIISSVDEDELQEDIFLEEDESVWEDDFITNEDIQEETKKKYRDYVLDENSEDGSKAKKRKKRRIILFLTAGIFIVFIVGFIALRMGSTSQKEVIHVDVEPPNEEDIRKMLADSEFSTNIPNDKIWAIERVKGGDDLESFSKRYYGNSVFWVYLYDANKELIPDPMKLDSGINIVIPNPDIYGFDIHSQEDIDSAEKKGDEILFVD